MESVLLDTLSPELRALIEQIAAFLGCSIRIEQRVRIETDSEHMSTILRSLVPLRMTEPTSLPAQSVLAPEEVKISGGKTCRCGKPIRGRGATCGAEECKKARQREYNQAYHRDRSAAQPKGVGSTDDENENPSEAAEESAAPEPEAAPFDWPPMTSWRVMSGPNAGVYLAQWELGDRLLDLITLGDQVLHRSKGMHTARLEGGKLRLAPDASAGAAL